MSPRLGLFLLALPGNRSYILSSYDHRVRLGEVRSHGKPLPVGCFSTPLDKHSRECPKFPRPWTDSSSLEAESPDLSQFKSPFPHFSAPRNTELAPP